MMGTLDVKRLTLHKIVLPFELYNKKILQHLLQYLYVTELTKIAMYLDPKTELSHDNKKQKK